MLFEVFLPNEHDNFVLPKKEKRVYNQKQSKFFRFSGEDEQKSCIPRLAVLNYSLEQVDEKIRLFRPKPPFLRPSEGDSMQLQSWDSAGMVEGGQRFGDRDHKAEEGEI